MIRTDTPAGTIRRHDRRRAGVRHRCVVRRAVQHTRKVRAVPVEADGFDPWASFDIESHTIDALGLVAEKLQQARFRSSAWKWVVVGLHSAMHGGFALVLRRSDGAQLLPVKLERKVYESWERERATGKLEALHYDHVDWFLELYKKTQDPQRMSYLGGQPLEPTDEQTHAVEKLNAFRGKLLHFSADTWSIETLVFTDLIKEIVPVLRFLLFQAQVGTFLSHERRDQAKQMLLEIEAEAKSIEQSLEGGSERNLDMDGLDDNYTEPGFS